MYILNKINLNKIFIFFFKKRINNIIKEILIKEMKSAKPYIRDSYYYKRLKSIKNFSIEKDSK